MSNLWINTSKIAGLVGYNKYVKKDKFLEIFIEYLYKKREDLKKIDEDNGDIKFMSDKEYIDDLIKNLDESKKEEINIILKNDIKNNDTLINKTNIIKDLTNNSDINKQEKDKITTELNSRINCNYGSNTENKSIQLFEEQTGYKVYENNSKLFNLKVNNYFICGKIDGKTKIDDVEYILEMKNRKNRIFNTVPDYEQIQLLIYTKLTNNKNILFTQCLDNHIQYEKFLNFENEELYEKIIFRLGKYTDIIYKLREDENMRKSFLSKTDNQKYKFLKIHLNWL